MQFCVDNMNSVTVIVLVVDSSLLGFDLLFRMDFIRELGGVHIDQIR